MTLKVILGLECIPACLRSRTGYQSSHRQGSKIHNKEEMKMKWVKIYFTAVCNTHWLPLLMESYASCTSVSLSSSALIFRSSTLSISTENWKWKQTKQMLFKAHLRLMWISLLLKFLRYCVYKTGTDGRPGNMMNVRGQPKFSQFILIWTFRDNPSNSWWDIPLKTTNWTSWWRWSSGEGDHLWGTWMSPPNLTAIHPLADELF